MCTMADNRREGKRDKGNYKRNRQGEQPFHHKQRKEDVSEPVEMTPVLQAFKNYQDELDRKHDRHERLVKFSRDTTIESKRIIFLLHRINGDSNRDKVLEEAEERLTFVQDNFISKIAHELKGQDLHQYLRAFSPGLQEYIEAVSFYLYIKEERLVSCQEVASRFTFPETEDNKTLKKDVQDESENSQGETDVSNPGSTNAEDSNTAQTVVAKPAAENDPRTVSLKLPPLEYMLGLADFTGELMRLCINTIGSGDLETPFQLVAFMRTVNEGFQSLGNLAGREMVRKSSVMRQSLKKMENACYVIKVRGSEIPKHMLKDALFTPQDSSSRDDDYRQEEMAM